MKQERMNEIADEIDDMILQLLVPARTEKVVDKSAFEKFYILLNELKEGILEEEIITRKLTGILFFVYYALSSEAQYCNYQSPLFMEVAKLEGDLKIIFGVPK